MSDFSFQPVSPTAGPTGTAAPSADDRSTTFRPVEGSAPMQSGEKLLVEAYAVFWIVAFLMLLLSWRRQRSLDQRVVRLEAEIAKAKRAAPGAKEREAS